MTARSFNERAVNQSSDVEGWGAGWIWLGAIGGKNVASGRRASRVRVAVEPLRQGRRIGEDKRHALGGAPAERALIAAIAARRVLVGRAVVVDVGAEFRRVAERRLEFGRDRGVVGAGEGGRRERRRGRRGEQLDDQREGDEERGQGRAKSRRAKLRLTSPPLAFGPTVHVDWTFL